MKFIFRGWVWQLRYDTREDHTRYEDGKSILNPAWRFLWLWPTPYNPPIRCLRLFGVTIFGRPKRTEDGGLEYMSPLVEAAREVERTVSLVNRYRDNTRHPEVATALAKLRAALANNPTEGHIPKGWKLVPIEATEQMINAMDARYVEGGGNLNTRGIVYALWGETYKAALDAALNPPLPSDANALQATGVNASPSGAVNGEGTAP